jgi:hypothetical protein
MSDWGGNGKKRTKGYGVVSHKNLMDDPDRHYGYDLTDIVSPDPPSQPSPFANPPRGWRLGPERKGDFVR